MNKEQFVRMIMAAILVAVIFAALSGAMFLDYNVLFFAIILGITFLAGILLELYLRIQHNIDKYRQDTDSYFSDLHKKIEEGNGKLAGVNFPGMNAKIDLALKEIRDLQKGFFDNVRNFFIMKNDSSFKLLVMKSEMDKNFSEIKEGLRLLAQSNDALKDDLKKIKDAQLGSVKLFWFLSNNLGDRLSPIIVEHFLGREIKRAEGNMSAKLMAVGSIFDALREGDVVWGAGAIKEGKIKAPEFVKFLAVRGPLTRNMIEGANVPQVYGDPGILMPLIYNPKIEKTCKVGIMPHYVDKCLWEEKSLATGEKFIDIESNWKKVIDEMLSCELIRTSSLHGVILSQAYGVPVIWEKYSDNILGGEFKFQDYFLGSGQGMQKIGVKLPKLPDLAVKQKILIDALNKYYAI